MNVGLLLSCMSLSLTERISGVLVGFDDEGERPLLAVVVIVVVAVVHAPAALPGVARSRREPQSLRDQVLESFRNSSYSRLHTQINKINYNKYR